MSLIARITSLAQAIGADIKALRVRRWEGALSGPDSVTAGVGRLEMPAGGAGTLVSVEIGRRPAAALTAACVVDVYKLDRATGTRTLAASVTLAISAWTATVTLSPAVAIGATDWLSADVVQGGGGGLFIIATIQT